MTKLESVVTVIMIVTLAAVFFRVASCAEHLSEQGVWTHNVGKVE